MLPSTRVSLLPLLSIVLTFAACGDGVVGSGAPAGEADAWVFPPPELRADGLPVVADSGVDDDVRADAGADSAAPDGATTPDGAPSPPASCPRLQITTDGRVANVRPAPNTSGAPVGTLANGSIVDTVSVTTGESIGGQSTWYEIKSGGLHGFVFETLVKCTTKTPPAPSGFYLPFACGKKVKVTQGNNTNFSHTGSSKYAFDFSLGIGTPMRAMAAGTVNWIYNKTKPGDPCYDGGGPSCISAANQVWIKHADGTRTIYAHLSLVSVTVGQKVSRGQVVGKSGSSGYSTGPHAHVARMKSCCQSIPLSFADVPGNGVPKTGDIVVSGNCP